MKRSARGVTLIELIVSMGLSVIIMSIGYGAYSTFSRADDVESKRERLTATAHSAMARIKTDVRSAGSVAAAGDQLVITTPGGRVEYRSKSSGIERIGRGRCIYRSVTAQFSRSGRGVNVAVRARANVHRRVIRVDLNSFVAPHNR